MIIPEDKFISYSIMNLFKYMLVHDDGMKNLNSTMNNWREIFKLLKYIIMQNSTPYKIINRAKPTKRITMNISTKINMTKDVS